MPQLGALIQEITEVFEGTKLGDGIGLLEANGIDDYASAAERAELRSRDEKTDWRRIDSKTLTRCNAAPAFCDARGCWFQLAAFLIAELNNDFGLSFIEQLINTTRSPGSWHDLLTKAQCAAIIKTLKLVSGHPDSLEQLANVNVAIQQLKYRPLSVRTPTTAPIRQNLSQSGSGFPVHASCTSKICQRGRWERPELEESTFRSPEERSTIGGENS